MSRVDAGPAARAYQLAYQKRHYGMTPELQAFGDALREWLGLDPLYTVDPDSKYGKKLARVAA